MKKRTAILLLIIAILLSVLSINVLAENTENPWYHFTSITLQNKAGTTQYIFDDIDHDTKTVVCYKKHSGTLRGTNAVLNESDNVVNGVTVTVLNPKTGAVISSLGSSVNAIDFKISKDGEKDVIYHGYFVQDNCACYSISYPVSKTTTENITIKAGTEEYDSDSKQIDLPPDETAKASHLQLNGFRGEIVSASQGVTISEDKRSATVNWYQANGKISLKLKWSRNDIDNETTISITDKRVSKLNSELQQTHGRITWGHSGTKPHFGDTITFEAFPEEGYKLDKFTVTNANGQPVDYTMDETNPNLMSLPIPYGEFSVSASFVPLEDGDKSSVALLKSFTIDGKTATPDIQGKVVIEGVTKSTDFKTLKPVFVCSSGADVVDKDNITFEPNTPTTVIVKAENGINTSKYYITIRQMQLDGDGTEENPFKVTSKADFEKFRDMPVPGVYEQTADIDLSGVTAPNGYLIGSFSGTYKGGGHSIKNLKIANTTTKSAAIFGTLYGTVENLVIDKTCSFSGQYRVSTIAQFLSGNGTIKNCTSYAALICAAPDVDNSANMYVGGIVSETTPEGTDRISRLENCVNYGTITITGENAHAGRVGGIAGSTSNSFVQNCRNYAAIKCGESKENYYGSSGNIAGGIVGQAGGRTTLVGCANSAAISAGGFTGGIVGLANDLRNSALVIESCYNTGKITGYNVQSDQYVGGIAGSAYGEIANCYNTGEITGETTTGSAYRGAILGYANRETGTGVTNIRSCYAGQVYTISLGGQADSAAVTNDTVAKTDADMKTKAFVDLLNSYTKPKSLVNITFALPAEGENDGFPVVSTGETAQNYEAKLLGFAIDGHQAVIDEANKTVTLVLPHGTALTSLTPTLTTSSGAKYKPDGPQNFTSPVTYTITSEDGTETAAYTVTVTAATESSGLGYFAVKQGSTPYTVTEAGGVKTVAIPASALASNGESALTFLYRTNSGAKADGTIDGVALTQTVSGAYDALSWPFSTATLTSGTKTLTMTFGEEQQTVNIVITPELSSLTVKVGDVAQHVEKKGNGYQLDLPDTASAVSVTAVPALVSDEVMIDGTKATTADVTVTGKDSFSITVGGEPLTVTINRVKTTSVTFTTTPADAAVTVIDQDGTPVQPDSDGVYTLLGGNGYSYTYRVSSSGYVTKTGSLAQVHLKGGSLLIDVSLAPAGSTVTPVDPTEPVTGEWPSFRGNEANNGVTSAKTPLSKDETVKSWSVSIGGTPTPPLLVNGRLYVLTGNTVKAIDPKTGTVTATSEQLVGSSQFATNPIAYGDGKFYIQLDKFSGSNDGMACVQAIDAATLKSVWVSEYFPGQLISPITYHNGYIYTGTWQAEERTGTYFCLSTTDEDPASTTETKYTSWRISKQGGFYWVGAYATDNYVIFGSDNGKGGYTEYGSTLYSVNAKTGTVIDTETNLIGDLRSAVVKSGNYVYFTSKAGILYRATVAANGSLSELQSLKLDGMITGTPVVYDGTVFVTCSGQTQFNSTGTIYAVDAATMAVYNDGTAKATTTGYIQSSLLVSDAYKADEGKLYIYGSCNEENGTINFFKYDVANHTFDTGVTKELYTPTGAEKQYNLCSLICDARGTIYFKNDSGYLTALAREIIETDAGKVIEKIDALFPITDDSLAAIKEARRYYEALSPEQKAEVDNLADLEKAEREYQQRLTNKRQTALDDLKKIYEAKDTKDFTTKGLQKLKEAYEEGVRNINNAEDCKLVESSFNAAAEKINKLNGKDITVTFRLIGALQATQDVNLTNDSYLPEYVTWIPTTSYDLQEDATVYDVYTKALSEYGLRSIGEDNDYVRTIYAPSCLGGYALSEFTNGARSGWMYTVNGTHPDRGLKNWKLKDGDVVIWHYINDYAHEAADWFDDPDYPALGDGTYYNGWLRAADISPEQYVQQLLGKILKVGKNGTVEPKLTLSHIGKSVTFTFKPDKGYHVKDVKVDGKSVGAVTTYTVDKLTVSTRIEVEFTNGVLPFTDVREADWFYDDVVYAYENGLFSGTSDTTFSPNASMTRAMLVTVLYRLEGQPTVSGRSGFSDVKLNSYYEDAVTWAADNGIVNGTGATTFSPNANVTREQMAAILYRYAQYKQYSTTASASLNGFSDAAKVSTYAKAPLSWAVAEKLVNGSEGKLLPTGNATRAQVAAILHRFVENVAATR